MIILLIATHHHTPFTLFIHRELQGTTVLCWTLQFNLAKQDFNEQVWLKSGWLRDVFNA